MLMPRFAESPVSGPKYPRAGNVAHLTPLPGVAPPLLELLPESPHAAARTPIASNTATTRPRFRPRMNQPLHKSTVTGRYLGRQNRHNDLSAVEIRPRTRTPVRSCE